MKDVDIRFIKLLVIVNGAVPLVLLCWDAQHNRLGANPQNFAILTTGMMALVFLILTMAVTPFRKIYDINWLLPLRRTFGLYAFFYACVHFLLFFGLDRAFNVASTVHEIIVRKYLWFGIASLLIMVPLALTSTNAMIKKLGGKRWRALHRLAYVAAVAAVVHYYMQVKKDVRLPMVFATLLAVLLAYRIWDSWRSKKPKPAPAR